MKFQELFRIGPRSKFFASEISKLLISKAWYDESYAYIKLENEIQLKSYKSKGLSYKIVYFYLPEKVKKYLPFDCIKCALDIILRYRYPHLEVLNQLPYTDRELGFFHKNHLDSVLDFNLSRTEIEIVNEMFKIKDGEVILDVGAHTGFGSIAIARRLKAGKVIAIEADPECFELLNWNVIENQLSDKIIPIHSAVWKENGEFRFYCGKYQSNSLIKEKFVKTSNVVTVTAKTIDQLVFDVLGHQANVDFINFTINGAEPEGIAGAKNTILNNQKIRVCAAGWYRDKTGKPYHQIISKTLASYGMYSNVGQHGKVIAWFG